MKWQGAGDLVPEVTVVPHAGTWIEMCLLCPGADGGTVVPHAGTWIEIQVRAPYVDRDVSCLTQARGLKLDQDIARRAIKVVPHAGTWIEIRRRVPVIAQIRRASRRHVD